MSFSTYVLLPLLLLITIIIVRDEREVDGLTLLTPQGRIWANRVRDVRNSTRSSRLRHFSHLIYLDIFC